MPPKEIAKRINNEHLKLGKLYRVYHTVPKMPCARCGIKIDY
jgi:hypothetical protein